MSQHQPKEVAVRIIDFEVVEEEFPFVDEKVTSYRISVEDEGSYRTGSIDTFVSFDDSWSTVIPGEAEGQCIWLGWEHEEKGWVTYFLKDVKVCPEDE